MRISEWSSDVCSSDLFLAQIGEFPFGAATDQRAVLDRADPGRIIAAIFHAAQPVDEAIRHLILADDSDDSAHGWPAFLTMYRGCGCPAWRPENPSCSASPIRGRASGRWRG